MKVMEWVKAHPYMTGALVIGGGLTFVLFSGWFSGGSSGGVTVAGSAPKSDAQIMAEAQLQAANIQAQAQNAQAGLALEAMKIQAGYEYNLGMKSLDVGREVSLTNAQLQKDMYIAGTQASVANNYLNSATILGSIALTNPIANTTTKKKSGFFGIGGGSSSSTTYTPQQVPLPSLGDIIGQIGALTGSTGGATLPSTSSNGGTSGGSNSSIGSSSSTATTYAF